MSYSIIAMVYKEQNTKGSERLLLLVLAYHANDEGTCSPSLQTLADECCCSRRFVYKLTAKLKARGYITTQMRLGTNNEYTSNLYTIHPDKFILYPDFSKTSRGER